MEAIPQIKLSWIRTRTSPSALGPTPTPLGSSIAVIARRYSDICARGVGTTT